MNYASKLFALQETKLYPSNAYYQNAVDKYMKCMQFHVILSRRISGIWRCHFSQAKLISLPNRLQPATGSTVISYPHRIFSPKCQCRSNGFHMNNIQRNSSIILPPTHSHSRKKKKSCLQQKYEGFFGKNLKLSDLSA